jgi:hypothetical protein
MQNLFTGRYQLIVVNFMADSYFYRGLYRVKVITESEGYQIIEAQEDFEDHLNGEKITVKTGEQRIVEPKLLYKKKTLPPPIPEHVYERKLEKDLKKLLNDSETSK